MLEIVQGGVVSYHLIEAIKNGDIEEARKLKAKGVDVNVHDDNGIMALAWATMENRIDIMKLVIANGADNNAKD